MPFLYLSVIDGGNDRMGVGSVLIYMGVLGFGAMISPGVGIFGGLITMVPQSVTGMSHLPAYGLLTWLLSGALQGYGWPQRSALRGAIATALVFGVGMEILQGFVPGRVVDNRDVLMNGVGIAMATLLILWRSMPADKADKLVPARSCTFHGRKKGARQP